MDVVEAVRGVILSLTPVTTLVGARVYSGILPQGLQDFPAVRLQRVDNFEDMHLRGSNGVLAARVQVDTFARTRAAVHATDAAMVGPGDGTGLVGWTGTAGGSPGMEILAILPIIDRELYDADELKLFRIWRDYSVQYRRA